VNDILKQRLVGALILVALGVIFWPIIFVEPPSDGNIENLRIPPRPDVDTTPIAAPDADSLRGSPDASLDLSEDSEPLVDDDLGWSEPPAVAATPETEGGGVEAAREAVSEEADAGRASPPEPGETRQEAPEQPALDAQGVPIAWMLQVASVSSQDKAEALRQRLEAMGEKAWVDPVSVGGRTMYRVNVGPKFERARLDALRPEVDTEFGVKSLVRRYLP
jgi:DedD protein